MIAMNIINIYENYNSYFNPEFKKIFELCSKVAAKNNYKLYLIGGLVRDMLLNKESLDIDITVEGDAIEFAHILQNEIGAKISSIHKDFGTVKVEINEKQLDFASTRSEIYPKKGHLPKVEKIGCTLEKDVLRRDFTINSLAMSLNQDSFANLIDYVKGYDDLKNKKIRVLHDKSFIDDPTRIIRALKYATRLDFELDKKTLKLQEDYLKNINYDMGYKRIKQELKKTFEQNSQEVFDEFIEQKIYKLITNCRVGLPSHRYNIEKLVNKHNPKNPWLVYFGVLLIQCNNINIEQQSKPPSFIDGGLVNPPYFTKSAPDIALIKYEKEVIENAKTLINTNLKTDFEIYKAFYPQKLETLLILAVLGLEKQVSHYLDNLQRVKLHINGNDLLELGLTPSKTFSEVFDYVLKEKLRKPNFANLSKAEELNLVKIYLN